MTKIFLDDERYPVLLHELGYEPDTNKWYDDYILGEKILRYPNSSIIICRNVKSAMTVLNYYQDNITEIMFDNDLGESLEGKDFAKMIIEWDLDRLEKNQIGLRKDIIITVHSQNIVASNYITNLMKSYLLNKINI